MGGTLTNFKRLLAMFSTKLRNAAIADLSSFKYNLKRSLQGLSNLRSLPGCVFFNSAKRSFWGTGEAYALRIPSGGVTDTDTLPTDLFYAIPGNDDAFGSFYFFNQLVAKTILIAKVKAMFFFSYRRAEKQRAIIAKQRARRLKRGLFKKKRHYSKKKKPNYQPKDRFSTHNQKKRMNRTYVKSN